MTDTHPIITDTGFVVSTHGGFDRHGHERDCEIHLFTRAQGEFLNGETAVKTQDGCLVFSWPGTRHSFRSIPTSASLQFYFVNFIVDAQQKALLEGCGTQLPVAAAMPGGLQYASLFESIRRRFERGTESAATSASHLLLSLLYDIAGNEPSAHSTHPAVERAIGRMRESVLGSLSLDECAKAAGVGKPYLMRLFREQAGASPMQYYQRLKMETARYLLVTSDEPVYQIATRLRFWDEFHFSRTFKRIVGVAPLHYRTRERGS